MDRHRKRWLHWGLYGLISGWLAASGCLCYGGGEPPPEDDDVEDDDTTNHSEHTEYELTGYYLDLGRDAGEELYEGLVITENGAVRAWTGEYGVHQDEEWVATLTQGQLQRLMDALGPGAFFESDIDEGGEPDCFVTFRLEVDENEAVHEAGDVPGELAEFYEELDAILGLFEIEHGCS